MKKLAGWGALLAVLAGLGYWFFVRVQEARVEKAATERPTEIGAVPVRTEAAALRDVDESVRLTGAIRPRNEIDIVTKIPGRVEKVLVDVGSVVEEGDLLIVIEGRNLALHSKSAKGGVAAASASVESARVGLDSARLTYDRMKKLYDAKAISKAEFERVESALRGAKSGLAAAEASLGMARTGVGLAGEALRSSRIVSPISGTVTKRMVDEGKEAMPGMPLLQIQDVSELHMEASVSAEDYGRLEPDQVVTIRIEDLPGATFTGRISLLSPSLDAMTRRAAVEVVVTDGGGRLLPNMFAQAEVLVASHKGILTVPSEAIVRTPTGPVVFTVKDGVAKRISVALAGDTGSRFVPVPEGLRPGDPVIVAGQSGILDGTEVRLIGSDKKKPKEEKPDKEEKPEKEADDPGELGKASVGAGG